MSTVSLRRNFFFNLIYPMMRLAVAIVTVPIYVHHVGDARYGVISIVWILLGYFGFLDLGLSRASTNALSKLRDAPQPDRARVLLRSCWLPGILAWSFLCGGARRGPGRGLATVTGPSRCAGGLAGNGQDSLVIMICYLWSWS